MPKYELFTTGEVPDLPSLRSYVGYSKAVSVSDATTGGLFLHDETDSSTADDDENTVVDYKGRRWKKLGAGNVSFLQSGTGAVRRSAQNKMRDIVSVKDFGAVGDGVTDDLPAFDAAIASFGATEKAGKIIVPAGDYFLNGTLAISKRITLEGTNRGQQSTTAGSILYFPANTTGIRVHSSFAGDSPEGTSGAQTSIRDIQIYCNDKQTTGHGIHASAAVSLFCVSIGNFAENGIHIVASASALTGNANLWSIRDVYSHTNGGHGFYCDGTDVNAGVAVNLNCMSNGGWGIWDSSFLGNTYIACHVASNGTGPYKTDDANAQNTFIGCYSEGGASLFVKPTVVIGGVVAGEGRLDTASTAFVMGGGGAFRRPYHYQNSAGSELIGSATGYAGSSLAAFSWGANVESGTLDAWKLRWDATNRHWYFQYALSSSFEPISLPDSSAPRALLCAGPSFKHGYTLGARSAPIIHKQGTAAPTTDAWLRGDVIFNSAPSAGGPFGWICVTAGTPGTWLPFGAIQSANAYTTSNVTTDRTFDADTVVVAELADVVGTLIADLKASGVLA